MDGGIPQELSSDIGGILVAALFLVGTAMATASWEAALVVLLFISLGETHLGLDFGFQVLEYTASPLDFLAAGLLVAAMFRVLATGGLNRTQFLWLAIVGYCGLRFVGGIADFGLQSAVSFYRQSFYAAAALLYALTVNWAPPQLDRLVKIWMLLGVTLAGAALLEWLIGDIIPRPSNWRVILLNVFDQRRVLPAASALILAEAGVLVLAVWSQTRPSTPMRILSVILLTVSFALLHRSVWMATLAGVLALSVFSRDFLLRVAPFLAIGVLGSGVIWMTQQGLGDVLLTTAVQSAIAEPFEQNSSIAWRLTGWELLLERAFSGGPATILFGAGYGAGYERQIGWSTVYYSPHNFYIATLLDAGVIGVCLWAYGLWRAGVGLTRSAPFPMATWRPGLIALLVMIVVYNIPYSHLTEQGFLIGMLAGAAGRITGPSSALASRRNGA